MRCSNCLEEREDVVLALPSRKYYVCGACAVTYGKNRKGEIFFPNEEVHIDDFNPKTNGRIFIITGIYILEECESGRMVTLKDKETDRPLKTELDINWLLKIKK